MAICSNNELIFEAHHDGATEHAEVLPVLVSDGLKKSAEIDEVVIGMGPGTFTGLRVGITFGQAFAYAREIPWIGVCSLDGIDIDSDAYIVATDARRKELYWARYEAGKRVEGPSVASPEIVSAREGKKFGLGFTEMLFPSPQLLLARSRNFPVKEPMYLRRPDAIPTNERRL